MRRLHATPCVLLLVLLFLLHDAIEGSLPTSPTFTMMQSTRDEHEKAYERLKAMNYSPHLKKFVEPLPFPRPVAPLFKSQRFGTVYEIEMVEAMHSFHRDLPTTRLWTYQSSFPGPTIVAHQGERIMVRWVNKLPEKHIFEEAAKLTCEPPLVRAVTHVHGGITETHSDGHPDAWFSPNFNQTGPMWERQRYVYENRQSEATLIYHDHAMGVTRLNVYAGLVGLYVIANQTKYEQLNIPQGEFDIPILLQDKSFLPDGSLFYPQFTMVSEYFGDIIVVNGKAWPYLNVKPRRYLLRLVNGCNSRFMNLTLDNTILGGNDNGPMVFTQVASEQGLLERPVNHTYLFMTPGTRVEVVVDFSLAKGKHVLLRNGHAPLDENVVQTVKFIVSDSEGEEEDSQKKELPKQLATDLPVLKPSDAIKIRDMYLTDTMDEQGRMLRLINNMRFHEPVTEKICNDTVEIWRIINIGSHPHPMHFHLLHFYILDKQPFDIDHYWKTKELKFTGPPLPPSNVDVGLKDGVDVRMGEVARIIFRFGPYVGTYVWHCHMLEHEEFDMMRPFQVVPC